MYYVYALYNTKANKIYIGQTMDLESRLTKHNNHIYKHSYTSRFAGEWKLVYKESCASRENALAREKQLKSFQGREFIKKIISRDSSVGRAQDS